MSEVERALATRAEDLRREFDGAFAKAPDRHRSTAVELLMVRLAAHGYLLRLEQIAGLFVDRRITPLPVPNGGSQLALLGIAGFRGNVVPVYELGVLLGYPPAERARWLLMLSAAPLALAVEGFAGYLRLDAGMVSHDERAVAGQPWVRDVASTPDGVLPLLDLAAVSEAITAAARRSASYP